MLADVVRLGLEEINVEKVEDMLDNDLDVRGHCRLRVQWETQPGAPLLSHVHSPSPSFPRCCNTQHWQETVRDNQVLLSAQIKVV